VPASFNCSYFNYEAFGLMGYRTPNIDRIGREGTGLRSEAQRLGLCPLVAAQGEGPYLPPLPEKNDEHTIAVRTKPMKQRLQRGDLQYGDLQYGDLP
jgi:hypothetical protein